MVGSFGFEANHYDVSMQVGDLVLLPAVRKASPNTLIVADGFSCREQIEQGTRRRAVHLAQALRAAIAGDIKSAPVEGEILGLRAPAAMPREFVGAALIAVGLAATACVIWRGRWRS
jgi:hypothetical protein